MAASPRKLAPAPEPASEPEIKMIDVVLQSLEDAKAELIRRISLTELVSLDLKDLVVERAGLELMKKARHIREIQFVNGLKPGQLTKALDDEPVGTVIYRDEEHEVN